MTASMHERTRWLLVVAFGIAMAWLESATVYYLRVMVDRVNPYQADPLPIRGILGPVELVREAATLVMLLAVGALAGRTWRTRIGYTAIAFGIWDIFYYVFLNVICGWPASVFDWDVLFLLPLPWWGPVLAPMSIALLMIVWGTLVTLKTDSPHTAPMSQLAGAIGIGLALYVFMADAIHAVHGGVDAARTVLPTTFNWGMFVVALALMAVPVVTIARHTATPALVTPLDPASSESFQGSVR
jgi:hypothetical protein